jgi:hypothetical protein
MAVAMDMTWQGVTPEQYDQVQGEVRWETEAPDGGIFHVAWFEEGVMRIVDVWESAEAFQAFVDARLMPGVAKVGIEGAPEVQVHPAHRVFDAAHGEARS